MTAFYEPRDEAYLKAKQDKAGAMGAIELFMCADGNYRDADSKARFDEQRRELMKHYIR